MSRLWMSFLYICTEPVLVKTITFSIHMTVDKKIDCVFSCLADCLVDLVEALRVADLASVVLWTARNTQHARVWSESIP